MKNYKHSVSTMEVLLWESEQTPKPAPHVITMPAQEGDLAWIHNEQKEYIFTAGTWVEHVEESVQGEELVIEE